MKLIYAILATALIVALVFMAFPTPQLETSPRPIPGTVYFTTGGFESWSREDVWGYGLHDRGRVYEEGGGELSIVGVDNGVMPYSGSKMQKSYTPPGPTSERRRAEGSRWEEITPLVDSYVCGAVYFPIDFHRESNEWFSILQRHSPADSPHDHFGNLRVYPGMQLEIGRNWDRFDGLGKKRETLYTHPTPIPKGRWIPFIIHLETGNPGVYELWWDGDVNDKDNPTVRLVDDFDSRSLEKQGGNIACGIYRGPKDGNALTVYHDNIAVCSTWEKSWEILNK